MIGVTVFYLTIVFWDQDNPFDRVRVKIPEGASLNAITNILHKQQVISNDKIFKLGVRLLGQEKSLPAGVFTLYEADNNNAIVEQLVRGEPTIRVVTIIEGWTIDETAAALSNALLLDREKIIALCHDTDFITELGVGDVPSLEGYLYPETYRFLEGQTEREIIWRLVNEFNDNFAELLKQSEEKVGLSELELITMASIIEGEAIFDEERPTIAAVYYNRLKRRMRLQADPTIQYILDGPPRRLLKRHLEIDSPYNTYRNYGLPPGPINSPGRQSILAALNPADVDYLYFVAIGDGYHTFSRTQTEHIKAKRKFQSVRRQVAREKRMKKQG